MGSTIYTDASGPCKGSDYGECDFASYPNLNYTLSLSSNNYPCSCD